jgi:hypothetical protein
MGYGHTHGTVQQGGGLGVRLAVDFRGTIAGLEGDQRVARLLAGLAVLRHDVADGGQLVLEPGDVGQGGFPRGDDI